MSGIIHINDLKFVIFGSGNDLVRPDSGPGDTLTPGPFFSHPKVPLNSVNYAGQYFFMVSNGNGGEIDAVKDDIAHCTFTPALGSTFDTEGPVDVEVSYYREYAGETVSVNLKQTIEVVDHGTVRVAASALGSIARADLYSDGYAFMRPLTVNTVDTNITSYGVARTVQYLRTLPTEPSSTNPVTKISSFPWRATGLEHIYSYVDASTGPHSSFADTSELENAPTSTLTLINCLFSGADNTCDLSGIANWDVSNVQTFGHVIAGGNYSDYSVLSSWDISGALYFASQAFAGQWPTGMFGGVTDDADLTALSTWKFAPGSYLSNMFSDLNVGWSNLGPTNPIHSTLSGNYLPSWDTANVVSMESMFSGCRSLNNIAVLASWDVSNVTSMTGMFSDCFALGELSAIGDWDVSSVTNMDGMFKLVIYSNRPIPELDTLSPLRDWDTSSVTSMQEMFYGNTQLQSLAGLETWDVSAVTNMMDMFGYCGWLMDIRALSGWTFNTEVMTYNMFGSCYALHDLNGVMVSLSSSSYPDYMFNNSGDTLYIDVNDTYWLYNRYTGIFKDYEGHESATIAGGQTVAYDASYAVNWPYHTSSMFSSNWTNVPA